MTVIISNKQMNNLIKIIKSLEDSGLFINALAKQVKRK